MVDSSIPWHRDINFASALLLHSCLTVIVKEAMNSMVIVYRLCSSSSRDSDYDYEDGGGDDDDSNEKEEVATSERGAQSPNKAATTKMMTTSHSKSCSNNKTKMSTKRRAKARVSAVLDAYTSILSLDTEGSQAELYFTNTGFLLLASTLAASVAMNLSLSNLVLNMLVSGTFLLSFCLSILVGIKEQRDSRRRQRQNQRQKQHLVTLPLMALRRAARFIWSDTPFVNFFTLVYMATVLDGQSTLRLQDYVVFRGIAIVELVFMKAKLAAERSEVQVELMKKLIASEWDVGDVTTMIVTWVFFCGRGRGKGKGSRTHAITSTTDQVPTTLPLVTRANMKAFQTSQRLSVMLLKTTLGFSTGSLQGSLGPCQCLLPFLPGTFVLDVENGLRVCRVSEGLILIVDCGHDVLEKEREEEKEGEERGGNKGKAKGRREKGTAMKRAWERFIGHSHGVLLRRVGKVRVVYGILREEEKKKKEMAVRPDGQGSSGGSVDGGGEEEGEEEGGGGGGGGRSVSVLRFHSNPNLVTGVSKAWVDEDFREAEEEDIGQCVFGL